MIDTLFLESLNCDFEKWQNVLEVFEKIEWPPWSSIYWKMSKKDIVSNVWNAGAKELEFIENGKSKLILFFILYLG